MIGAPLRRIDHHSNYRYGRAADAGNRKRACNLPYFPATAGAFSESRSPDPVRFELRERPETSRTYRTTNFRSPRYGDVFAETRKFTPPYQARKSQEVLRQTGFETGFAEKCHGRSQELLALGPTRRDLQRRLSGLEV